jgi:hypothetical protein
MEIDLKGKFAARVRNDQSEMICLKQRCTEEPEAGPQEQVET